jgi:hypothetical protein
MRPLIFFSLLISRMVDKRKEITPARLEQLAKMRARLAEVQKEKKEASEALKAQAKKTKKAPTKAKPVDEGEAVEDEEDVDAPVEEDEESEPDEIKPVPKIKRKPKAGHVTTRSEGMPEFYKVKEMIDMAYPELSAQRKKAKWQQRKSEILSEVQQMIKPDAKEDKSKPAPAEKPLVDISQLFS